LKSRKENTQTIKEAFERLLDEYKIRGKYNESYIVAEWEKIVGKTIASKTNKLFIRDKKLYLQTDSAPLKHHLSMNKNQLIDLINDKAGIAVITDLILF
jgi:predicted nucleic acid-binding Zn ribbon protein